MSIILIAIILWTAFIFIGPVFDKLKNVSDKLQNVSQGNIKMKMIREEHPIVLTVIRPTEVGIVERFGKYNRSIEQGLNVVIPLVDTVYKVNVTEQMVDITPQTVITKDKLNVVVDAIVYYKINDPKSALYNVNNHETQLVSLTKTTLRSVIGQLTLTETNENRSDINIRVKGVLEEETSMYGVGILRVEIQKIEPPSNVQDAMNEVVRMDNIKLAAVNEALAVEIKADGRRKASIKEAEGQKKSRELNAEGEANAIKALAEAEAEKIKVVNESIQKNFIGQAVEYKKLETALGALENGTKIIVGKDSNLVNVIGDTAGIVPIEKK